MDKMKAASDTGKKGKGAGRKGREEGEGRGGGKYRVRRGLQSTGRLFKMQSWGVHAVAFQQQLSGSWT